MGEWLGWLEEWRLKLTSAKVEVEVEAELGNNNFNFILSLLFESERMIIAWTQQSD